MPGSCLDFDACARRPTEPAPALGAHTDEVLGSLLGLSGRQIEMLHERQVIAGPQAQWLREGTCQ